MFDRYVKRGIARGILAAVLPVMVGGAIRGPFHDGPAAAELTRDWATGALALAGASVLAWAVRTAEAPGGDR